MGPISGGRAPPRAAGAAPWAQCSASATGRGTPPRCPVPTGSAGPNAAFMRGLNPAVTAYGSPARRMPRSSVRTTSRCDRNRSRPALRYPMRTRNSPTAHPRGHDVHAEHVARVAPGASREAAVGRRLARQRALALAPQVAPVHTRREVLPRQRLVAVALAVRDRRRDRRRPRRRRRASAGARTARSTRRNARPCAMPPRSPRATSRSPRATTPSRNETSGSCHDRSTPRRGIDCAQHLLPARDLVPIDLRVPLERRVDLGHERRDRHRELRARLAGPAGTPPARCASTRPTSSPMPATSSSVSVGRPIMK